MSSDHDSSTPSPSLAARLEHETGVRAADCYQCGKCTAGCPQVSEMDVPPSQLLRLVQMDLPAYDKRVLASRALWMCVGCETCVTRCPNEIDLPKAMDLFRQEAMREDLAHEDSRDIIAFHKAFLGSIESHGRLYELGFLVDYKLRTGHVLKDVTLAPPMLFKGKLGLVPHGTEDGGAVAAIFGRTRLEKKGTQS